MTKKNIFSALVILVCGVVGYMIFGGISEQNKIVYSDILRSDNEYNVEELAATLPQRQDIFTLGTTTVMTGDGTVQTFQVPEGVMLTIAAENLGKVRFMAWSPDGRLFVPDMVDYLMSPNAKLWVLGDFDPEKGTFGTRDVFLSPLQGVNDVAFYRDSEGQDWLYIAETAYLKRYRYTEGDMRPQGSAEIVATFPGQQSIGEESVVWHITRTLEFVDDELYISIGSGCNSCEELAGERAMIIVMNPDGSNVREYATGLRNAVGIEWARGQLYATANGADHLGIDAPDEALFSIEEGTHYAWPYCYLKGGEWYNDVSQVWRENFSCIDAPTPVAVFPPRSAALGVTYFDESVHPLLVDSFLVALHGSFEAYLKSGYKIVRVTPSGEQKTFIDGFQLRDATRVARPVDILMVDQYSFLFTDDYGGRIYHVRLPEGE